MDLFSKITYINKETTKNMINFNRYFFSTGTTNEIMNDIVSAIETELVIGKCNRKEYIEQLQIKFEKIHTVFIESTNDLLRKNSIRTDLDNETEKVFTTNEVCNIFDVKRGSVKHWADTGKLKVIQKMKNNKMLIPVSAIDEFVINNPKYKNNWINYQLNKK